MSLELLRLLDSAKARLERSMQIASETDGIDMEESEDDVLKITEDLCTAEENLRAHQKSLQVAARCETSEEFDKVYAEGFQKNQVKDIKATQGYKTMTSSVNIYLQPSQAAESGATTNVVDDDIEMEDNLQRIDPLTKNPLINPVRNKLCKHVYEKTSITEAIRMNSRTRCPVMGCGNKHFLALNHLEEDNLLKKKLAHLRAQEQKEAEREEETDSD